MKTIIRKFFSFFNKIKNIVRPLIKKMTIKRVGQNFMIYGKVDIICPWNLTVGSDCTLNHGVYINAFNPIYIGNDVTISSGAKVISTGINIEKWNKGEKEHITDQDVFIGDHVWIGANALILGGVHITGEYVVIAAGAIVTKDISESHCLVVGCPAKIVKYF